MPYIGRAATNTGNVRYLDDIASGFDGSDTTFTAQVGGVSITPDQESVKIFLDGVFQHPGSGNAYTISGSTITFTAAPVANTVFSAYVVGAGAYLDDNAVSSAKLDDDAVTAAKLDDDGTGFQVGDLGVGGSLTSGDKLTVTGRLRASGGIIGDLTGNVTGNVSGTALTVTQAAQTAITSVGTLTGLTVSGETTFSGFLNDAKIYNHLKFVGSDGTTVHGGVRGASNSVEIRTGASTTVACTFDGSQNATFAGDVSLASTKKLWFDTANWSIGKLTSPTGASAVTSAGVVVDVYDGSSHGFMVRNTSNESLLEIVGSTKTATFAGRVNVTQSGNSILVVGSTGSGQADIVIDASNGDASGGDYAFFSQYNDLSASVGTASSAGNFLLKSKGSTALTLDGTTATFAGQVTATGIKFDASGEVLDDYEEGVVNLSSLSTSEGGTISLYSGNPNYGAYMYTKIGNLCTVHAGLIFDGNVSGTDGDILIPLPFTPINSTALSERSVGSFISEGNAIYVIRINSGDANARVQSTTGIDTYIQGSAFSSGYRVIYTVTYRTA